MSDHVTAGQARPGDGPGALRILALVAVGIGLAALAGAAFVLSYAGIHAFALQAGVSPKLAKGYPLIFDVLLVIILAAVLALRGAGLPSKMLAWTCLIALLAAAAGADAMHAAGRKLPHQSAAVTAAIVPWVLVLIALALLLAMLRHARQRRLGEAPAGARWQSQERPPRSTSPLVPGFDWAPALATPESARAAEPVATSPEPARTDAEAADSGPDDTLPVPVPHPTVPHRTVPHRTVPRLTVPRRVTAATAAQTGPAGVGTPVDDGARNEPAEADAAAGDDETAADPVQAGPIELNTVDADPVGAEADGSAAADGSAEADAAESEDTLAEDDPADLDASDGAAPDEDAVPEGDTESPEREPVTVAAGARADAGDDNDAGTDPEMPVFHRMWSAPTPPDSPAE